MSVREEIMSLRKRLEELGELLPTLPSPVRSPPASHSSRLDSHQEEVSRPPHKRQRRIASIDQSEVDGAVFNRAKGTEAEGSVKTLEEWAGTGTRGVTSVLPLGAPGEQAEAWRFDAANPFWANPKHFYARVELSREAAALFPSVVVIEELVDTFFYRCNHLCGHVLFEPRFRRLSQLSYKSNLTTEEILTSPLYVDPSCWAIMFMVLSISLCFYPYESDKPTDAFHAVNEFRVSKGEEITEKMHNISRRCLALHESLSFSSLPALQAATLMIFRAREPDPYIRQLLRITISSAQSLGYHQLGNFDSAQERDLVCRARQESIARLWAYLCVRDWCSSERDGTYTIQPLQCTTRAPMNISDSELLEGRTESRPRSEFSETAYPLAMFSLAKIIREIQDAQQLCGGSLDEECKDRFSKQLLRWLWALPPFYQLGATTESPRIIIVQRWMLHQQAFHQLLKLCRGDLSLRTTRESILDLAHSVLITHTRVTSMCPVVKTMWVNWMHLWNAGVIVGFDLLDTDDEQERLDKRANARNKIHGAIDSIRKCAGSERGSKLLEALLEMEEHRHARRIAGQGTEPLKFRQLAVDLIRTVAEKSAEPIWRASDFQYPSKAHDAILPALATSTIGNGHTDIIRVEDWRRVALESGLGAFEPVHNMQDPNEADADDLLRIVMASAPGFDATAFDAQTQCDNLARKLSDVWGSADDIVTMTTYGQPSTMAPSVSNEIDRPLELNAPAAPMHQHAQLSPSSETPAAFAPSYVGAGAVAVGLSAAMTRPSVANSNQSLETPSATASSGSPVFTSGVSNDNDNESNTSISTPSSGAPYSHLQYQQGGHFRQYHHPVETSQQTVKQMQQPNGARPVNVSDEQQALAAEWGSIDKGEAFYLAQAARSSHGNDHLQNQRQDQGHPLHMMYQQLHPQQFPPHHQQQQQQQHMAHSQGMPHVPDDFHGDNSSGSGRQHLPRQQHPQQSPRHQLSPQQHHQHQSNLYNQQQPEGSFR